MVIYRIFGLKKSFALKICSKQKSALSLASPALGRELDLKDRREVRRSWGEKEEDFLRFQTSTVKIYANNEESGFWTQEMRSL